MTDDVRAKIPADLDFHYRVLLSGIADVDIYSLESVPLREVVGFEGNLVCCRRDDGLVYTRTASEEFDELFKRWKNMLDLCGTPYKHFLYPDTDKDVE